MKCRFLVWALGLVAICAGLSEEALRGAGATFPFPLYQKWIASFAEKFPAGISYRPIGSSAGVEALRKGEVDFAASDAPLTDRQVAGFASGVRHIPTVVGGVVPIYHLNGMVRDLRFTGEILAGIYLGKIRRWDDPRIRAVNHGTTLPAKDIVVVHRSDGSGTTYIWTDYLSKISEEWRTAAGTGAEVHWPVGTGASGNEGVADAVGKTADAIGYVEFIYALQSRLSYGEVRNAAGHFIAADLSSLAAAAAAAPEVKGDDLRMSLTNASGAKSYPIAAFTYFLVARSYETPAKAKLMSAFLYWMLTSGQKQSAALGYAALPDEVAKRALNAVEGLQAK
ncbi:MAG TPA: phosphate ABC transporter substrate-binding protein PstS [Bryobacteraceae bacterium]|jgi:phosphate transport system substrate-binding protein